MKIKVLSYNIHKGRAFFSRRRIWTALDLLVHTTEPDIVFLQEFLEDPDSEKLLEKFADHIWLHRSLGQNATTGNYKYGNAILSKFPFVETHNTNISTNQYEKRGLLYGKVFPDEQEPLHLFCTHFDLTQSGRLKQSGKICNLISDLSSKEERFILAGDFNDWNAKVHKKLRACLSVQEVFETTRGKLIPTSPSIVPILPLDRIYSSNLKIIAAKRVFDKTHMILSDHLPLIAEFDF